jgi:general secretion pathway protein D
MGPSQVTLEEAYQAFLSALDANGLTTVKSGKFIRIIESAEARRAPVETYAGDYTPDTDQFITRIFQLKYINADEVQREFRDLTTRQGKLFAYEPTNSIIITDTGSNIKRIQEILDTLDVKGFETTLHVLRIKNSSSKAISEMLGDIYGDNSKGGGGGSRPRTFRRSALERTRGGGVISKIVPDEQTNSLLVLANRAGFEQLQQLVRKLDVKVTDTGRIHVYYCEYAKAEDLAATLASLSGSGGAGMGKSTNRRATVTSGNTPGGAAANPERTPMTRT